jgi:hypothetical protein
MLNIKEVQEYLNTYLANEKGAVTVDFVVLTAGVVLIATAAGTALTLKVSTAIAGISL